jgi:hypothetical protein
MTDPIGITAGAVGIAAATLHSVNTLIDDIQAIKNAPDAIADLKQDLCTIETVLRTLDSQTEESALEGLSLDAKSGLSLATAGCKRACDKFRTKLKKWTKHSADDTMHWWDRVRVALFAEAEIEILSARLSSCKDTVNAAINTAALYVPTSCLRPVELMSLIGWLPLVRRR